MSRALVAGLLVVVWIVCAIAGGVVLLFGLGSLACALEVDLAGCLPQERARPVELLAGFGGILIGGLSVWSFGRALLDAAAGRLDR